MKGWRHHLIIAILLVAVGCAQTPDSPRIHADAAALLDKATAYNAAVNSMRGLGRVDATRNGKRVRLRVAWVAEPPDKYRVVLLGAPGQPVMTVSSDGQRVYLDSHDSSKIRTWSTDSAFRGLVNHLVISPGDIALLLSGRIPIREFTAAEPTESTSDAGSSSLMLSRWHVPVQRIGFRGEDGQPVHVEFFTDEGDVGYWLTFGEPRSISGYRLPGRIEAGRNNGDRLLIEIDRYWPDVNLSPDVFVLNPG